MANLGSPYPRFHARGGAVISRKEFLAARYDFRRRCCDDQHRSVSWPAPRSG